MKSFAGCMAFLMLASFQAHAQPIVDSVPATKQYKNVIRYNLSGPLLFGFNYVVFGYERVVKSNQTFSINAGRAVLPKVLDFQSDDATLTGNRNNTGYNISVDYRFYLKKENKYGAPHGVYIGPFYSYNKFQRQADWRLDEASGSTAATSDSKIAIHTIGAEVGYQFVLGKRWTLDLVMIGPGFGNYKLNAGLAGNLTPQQKEKILNAVQAMLEEKFPGMDVALSDARIDGQGNLNTWNIGYRYIMHVGFRF